MREGSVELLLAAGHTCVQGGDGGDAWWERQKILLGEGEGEEIFRRPGDGFGKGRHVQNNVLLDVAELLELRAGVPQSHPHEGVQRNGHWLVPQNPLRLLLLCCRCCERRGLVDEGGIGFGRSSS